MLLTFNSPFLLGHSFELSPEDVVQFCSNCVMGGEEEECEIPDAFYELIDEIGYEKST